MDSNGGSPEGNLVDILTVLESKTTGNRERHETYQKFTRLFEENEISLFALDVVKSISRVLTVIKKDILLKAPDVNQCALQVLGVCLHDSEIVRSMSITEGETILQTLVDCINKTEEKGTCTRALWCIGKQNLPAEAVTKQVSVIMDSVEFSVEKFGSVSVTVEHESINTIARIAEQCPREMEGESHVWGKILVPMVVHSAIKVRERGLSVVENTLNLMKSHTKEIVSGVMPVFKTKVMPELLRLFNSKHELYVMRCWGILVQVFGEELHHGSYINSILSVVEQGFKSPSADVKIAAFTAWQQLIDNFATNPNVLGDPKRIKLIMQVFKLNNAKQENIAVVKMKVWWHFIWLLGNKVTANFDMVGAPFLQVCLGGSKGSEQNGPSTPRILPNGTSPKTPQMNLTKTTSQFPVFPAVHLFGCEALAHFMGSAQQNNALEEHEFKLDCLRQDVVTGPSFFIKQSQMMITTATELFINLGKDIPESLLFHIWDWLIIHLRTAIESPAKLDIRDTLNVLFTRFQLVLLSRVFSSQTLLKMFQSICQLPEKVLSSSAYSIGGNEMINGTPALFLAGLLLTPSLLQSCSGQENYHTLFKSIVNCGLSNSSGMLRFLLSLLELVSTNGRCVQDKEMVWRLWSAVVNPLLEHISKTNEVNQGDSLEPNFDCCVRALVLPVELQLASMPQPTMKSLVKTWTELYKTINRLAAMVTNANVICEDVCLKILENNKENELEAGSVDLQVHFCHVMTTCLDFSSLSTQSSFNIAAVCSPKWSTKKRHQPLENIHSLIALLCLLHESALSIVGQSEQKKPGIPLQAMMNNLVDIYSTIFTHVNSTSIIGLLIGQLAKPIGMLYSEASRKSSTKVYNNAFQQKLEKLWQDICTCLQSRFEGLFDSDMLNQLSPLLEATFIHSRRQIKNQTVGFWSSTFGVVSTLVYPESLKSVLFKVKEKSTIQLPGWINMNTPVIEETPISQMSQSQIPEPRIPGMPSPHKIHGSFLNKALSPKPKKSPIKSPISTRATNSAKKKVFKGLDATNDDDFVVIKASPKKKMVLTEHQREMMKERRVLPAMYNSLEASMDASLMSSHFTTDTQMESSNSTPTPTIEKEPFSLFGSSLNTTSSQTKPKANEAKLGDEKSADENKAEDKIEDQPQTPDIPKTKRTRGKKKDDVTIKSPDNGTESTRERRSSQTKTLSKDANSLKSSSDETEEVKDCESHKDFKKPNAGKGNIKKEDSVIVIEESEPMEVEPSQLILNSKSNKNMPDNVEIDLTKDSQDTSAVSQSGNNWGSVPQNILGVIGYTPPSSSSTSTETGKCLSGVQKQEESIPITTKPEEKDGLDDPKSVQAKITEELPSSEPLFSWTQKLEELSQSPGLKKSPFKKSLSQDSKSPMKRVTSPLRSPRGKQKENLSMKGALDKWIIRSPVKKVTSDIIPNMNTEIVVQNVLSSTCIEETQSPTKFNKKEDDALDKTNSPSVMETPIKNILEELDVNHGHSNRKLFDSQGSNHGNDVEDSNIVPASPTSKSFLVHKGTPIVKMRKLSDAEIQKFSPDNKIPTSPNVTPTKVGESDISTQKSKCIVNFSKNILEDESSHEHDDFSDLKPLENDTELNDVFSKSLTATDRVLLQINDPLEETNEIKDKTGNKPAVAVSPTLFSQFDDNNEKSDAKANTEPELTSKTLTEKQPLDSDPNDSSDIGSQGFSTGSQSSLEMDCISETNKGITPRRGRKRKQVTPKKMSPEEAKSQKKRMRNEVTKETEQRSQRKISNRLKEKKEKEMLKNSQETETGGKTCDNKKVEKVKETLKNSQTSKAGSEICDNKKVEVFFEDEHEDDSNDVEMEEEADHNAMKLDGSQPTEEEIKETKGRKGKKSKKTEAIQNNVEIAQTDEMTQKESKEDKMKNLSEFSVEKSKSLVTQCQTDQMDKEEEKGKDLHFKDSLLPGNRADKVINEDKEMEVDQVTGETTPKSRNTAKLPERRSTTKHKKEVALKMVLKSSQDSRDEFLMDNDSNLDVDELMLKKGINSGDSNNIEDKTDVVRESKGQKIDVMSDSNTQKKGLSGKNRRSGTKSTKDNLLEIAEENKLIQEVTESLNECEKEELTVAEGNSQPVANHDEQKGLTQAESSSTDKQSTKSVSDLSSQSDDDVPLIHIKNKKNKKKSTDTKQPAKTVEKDGQRSPVSNKLRSSKLVGTRLRSGQVKGKTSPQSKKSVSLALKRTRMKQKKSVNEKLEKAEPISAEKDDNVEKDLSDELVTIDNVEKEFEKENEKIPEVEEHQKETEVPEKDQIELDTETDSLQEVFNSETANDKNSLVNDVVKVAASTNETPRKLIESSKQAGSLLMMNSDSKLVLGSRRFEKRKAFARRSILKPTSASFSSQVGSPKRRDFHPIILGQVYSPTASPSASILKKRRLLESSVDSDTDSPPAKQRRVSFAEPLIEEGNVQANGDVAKPPSAVITDTENTNKTGDGPLKPTASQSTQSSSMQSSEGSISQGTYQSTQDSQLYSTEPVCPDLIDCEQSVEKILPQLTSSIWSRGLGQLVRARNIKTIGDLSALSETDIQSLPIRSPKVETVRKTLSKFQNLHTKSFKYKDAPRVRLESKITAEGPTSSLIQDEDPLPKLNSASVNVKNEIPDKMSTVMGVSRNGKSCDSANKSCDSVTVNNDLSEVLTSSQHLQEELTKLSRNLSQTSDTETDNLATNTDVSTKLVENFKQCGGLLIDNIKTFDKEHLVEALKTISDMQMSLLGAINWKEMM